VAHLPRILYNRVLSKHGDSPAVIWAESDELWKLELMCLLAMQLRGVWCSSVKYWYWSYYL